MNFGFLRSCSSCNRPPLADWLITVSLIIVTGFAVLLAWFVLTTIFG
jgi:hypothetical protein